MTSGSKTLAIFCLLVTTGCQTDSSGQGRVTDSSGNSTQSVVFQFSEEFLEDGNADVIATLSNGEIFRGKMIAERSTTVGSADVFSFDKKEDDLFLDSGSTTFSSRAKGVMFSASRSMQCQMTLANPSIGFSGGGVGQCKISTGETVPMQING